MSEPQRTIINLKDFTKLVAKLEWFKPPTQSVQAFLAYLDQIRFILTMAKYGGNLPGESRKPVDFYAQIAAELECQLDQIRHEIRQETLTEERATQERIYRDNHDFGDPVFNEFYRAVVGLDWNTPRKVDTHGKLLVAMEQSERTGRLRDIAITHGTFYVNFWNRQCDIHERPELKIKVASLSQSD